MNVHCADCGTIQRDEGKRSTCSRCGSSPLPSYEYEEDDSCHPTNCDCVVSNPGRGGKKLPQLERKTPMATLKTNSS